MRKHRFRAYIEAHRSAFKLGFRNLSLAPIASIVTIAAIGLCLSLPLGLVLFTKNVQKLSAGWDQSASMTLFIDAKSTPEQIKLIQNTAKTFPFVGKMTTITAEKALQEFQTASGLKELLNLLPDNPLPAVIQIQLNELSIPPEQIAALKQKLAEIPQVEQLNFDQAWGHKLQSFLSFGATLAHFLYCIVGFGVLFVIGNTLRLSLEQHREETEVLQLIGATTAFIRRPFLYRGALYGGLSGIVATVILSLALLYFKKPTQHLASLFDQLFTLEYLQLSDALAILGISILLGWVGAWIAFIQQHSALQYSRSNIY